jgi:hypothetical protein
MATILSDSLPAISAQSGFLCARDLFDFRRGHFPGSVKEYRHFKSRQDSDTDCRIVSAGTEITPYGLPRTPRWANYGQIRADLARWRAVGNRHGSPFDFDLVFAPLKLVVPDSNRRLWFALTADPIYPSPAWMAFCRDGLQSTHLYAAVGVLNSAFGLAAFHRLFHEAHGEFPSGGHKFVKAVAERIPLFRSDARAGLLADAAQLVRRLQAVAQFPHPEGDAHLGPPEYALRLRLCSLVAQLLEKDEAETERELAFARGLGATDVPGQQLTLAEALDDLPALTTQPFMSPAQDERLEALRHAAAQRDLAPAEVAELASLERRAFMQRTLTAPFAHGSPADETRGPNRETWLLRRINRGLTDAERDHYRALVERRRTEQLTPVEHAELLRITARVEGLTADRAEYLVELARLRGCSLPEVMRQLGLQRPAYIG